MDWWTYLGAFFVGAIGSILAWIFVGRPIVRHMTWKGIEDALTNIEKDPKSKEAQLLRKAAVTSVNFVLEDKELRAVIKQTLGGYATDFGKMTAKTVHSFLEELAKQYGVQTGQSSGGTGGISWGMAEKLLDKIF